MTVTSVVFVCAIFVAAILDQVTAWTIDLPEVRRFYFERYDSRAREDRDSILDTEGRSFDNINGDSLYNTNEFNYHSNLHGNHDVNYDHRNDYTIYANSYRNYESYMAKKVQTALHNGTEYMEGLRRSIERYAQLLENCSRVTYSTELPPEMTSRLSIGEFSGLRDYTIQCEQASRASERVRRLAALALNTARRLQDVAYTSKYNKDDSMEENELLLRLAWYLDKLAHLTGYDPDPHAHTTLAPPVTSTPTPTSLFPLPEISDETNPTLLNCLRADDPAPATERCAFAIPQPALREVVRRFGLNESSFRLDGPQPSRVSRQSSDPARTSLEPELLLATDNKHTLPPKPATVKSVRKRSISDSADPLVKVLKYYAKYKVWTNSNPDTDISQNSPETIDVKNGLHSIRKRSVYSSTKINKLPEDPMQDLSKYIKSKPNIYYNIDRAAADRLKAALEAIHSKKLLSRNKIKKLSKIMRYKRSVPIEHVRETIKTNTDIHYDIPKDITDKFKSVIHNIHVPIAHLHEHHPPHIPIVDVHHHGHHGHVEHISKDIKTNFHYDNLHKADPAEKIKAAIHHLHAKKVVIAKKIENLRKIFRPKRAILEKKDHYYHHEGVVLPRVPENPQGDISYYVKNKPGTNFNRNLGQAALVRLSLEEAFQRGNINVVHRYGANYNPAIPLPFYVGLLRSLADS